MVPVLTGSPALKLSCMSFFFVFLPCVLPEEVEMLQNKKVKKKVTFMLAFIFTVQTISAAAF